MLEVPRIEFHEYPLCTTIVPGILRELSTSLERSIHIICMDEHEPMTHSMETWSLFGSFDALASTLWIFLEWCIREKVWFQYSMSITPGTYIRPSIWYTGRETKEFECSVAYLMSEIVALSRDLSISIDRIFEMEECSLEWIWLILVNHREYLIIEIRRYGMISERIFSDDDLSLGSLGLVPVDSRLFQREYEEITSREGRVEERIPTHLFIIIDIERDSIWSRIHESYEVERIGDDRCSESLRNASESDVVEISWGDEHAIVSYSTSHFTFEKYLHRGFLRSHARYCSLEWMIRDHETICEKSSHEDGEYEDRETSEEENFVHRSYLSWEYRKNRWKCKKKEWDGTIYHWYQNCSILHHIAIILHRQESISDRDLLHRYCLREPTQWQQDDLLGIIWMIQCHYTSTHGLISNPLWAFARIQ